MSNLRVPFAVVAGVLFSSAVFIALSRFVSAPLDIGEPIKAQPIEFTRQRVDTPTESVRDKKIERPPPAAPTPHAPTGFGDPGGGIEPTQFVRTKIDVGPMDRGGRTVGVDRDVIPIVRVAPDYPPRAQSRGVEGWVQIRFAVTPTGSVRDPVVVGAEPQGVFEDAALKAIARWRYSPRIDGGVAVERVGLETVIRFEISK